MNSKNYLIKYLWIPILLAIMSCSVWPVKFSIGEGEKKIKHVKIGSECGVIKLSGTQHRSSFFWLQIEFEYKEPSMFMVFPRHLEIKYFGKDVNNSWDENERTTYVVEKSGADFLVIDIIPEVDLSKGAIDLNFDQVFQCNGNWIDVGLIKI
ncbi:MAG: hypothetical protein WC967_15410 [Balneolaceae bacterium]